MQRDRASALSALTLALLASSLASAQEPATGSTPAPSAAPAPAAAPKPPAAAPRRRAAQANQGPRPGLADSVWLRDGTRLRGTLLRVEPGNYVLLLGIEGVRTIPWRSVARVENAAEARAVSGKERTDVALLAPCCASEFADAAPRGAEDAWADLSLGWDLRGEGVALFKRYTVAGRDVWYGGDGFGGGASISLHFRGPAWHGIGAVRWSEFELGVGDSLHSVVWKQGAEYETKFLENQTSLILGAHFASGHWSSEAARPPWSGVVLGVAWVPTYVRFFGSKEFDAVGRFHPAGLRATLDWGRITPGRKGRMPGLRAFFTWLPYVGHLPTSVSFGLGAVFF